jgi:uncharacterized protein
LNILKASAEMEWRKAAEGGDGSAQYNLGFFHLWGMGLPKDPFEAVNWLRKAAEQGHALAQTTQAAMT